MKIKLYKLFVFFLILLGQNILAQKLDSLKLALKNAKHDTVRVNALVELSDACELEEIPGYVKPAVEICEQNLKKYPPSHHLYYFYSIHLAAAFNNQAYLENQLGEVQKAIDNYDKSLELNKKVNNKQGIASSLNNIGFIYKNQGDIPKALEYFMASLKIQEVINDKKVIAATFNNIGLIFLSQGNRLKAEEFFNKGLKLNEEVNDKDGIAYCLNNLGVLYKDKGNDIKALEFYEKSYKLREEIGNKSGMAYALNSIGVIYYDLKDFDKALSYFTKSLRIQEETNDKEGLAFSLYHVANVKFHKGLYNEALVFAKRGLKYSEELGYPANVLRASYILSKIYAKTGNFKEAYIMQVQYKLMDDSINNEKTKKASIQKGFQYAYEKKATADSIKAGEEKKVAQAKLTASEASLKQEKTQRFALYGGLVLVLIFAGFMFNRYKVTQKQKHIIEAKEKETQQQNEIITHQKHLVEEKHREITDSINYAERIQRSFLATDETLKANLNEYFVFFKPKDVVSGDFYWAASIETSSTENTKNLFYFVTADSTGHGVPGAIMSLLNITSLEKAIEHHHNPAEILNATRQTIIERLKKDGSSDGGKDGMDCSLIMFDFNNNKIQIAAANNPVWIIRDKVLIEIKPDKMPVGKNDREKEQFTLHEIDVQAGDVVYALTDGFPDQFGGPKGKKFMSKNLKELLVLNSHKALYEQKNILEKSFRDWVNDLEQVDDVTIVGIRI